MGRDEYAALYNNYQVISASFRIDGCVSGSVPIVLGYSVRRDSVVATGQRYIEMGETTFKVLNDSDGNTGHQMLNGYVNIANESGLVPSNSDLESVMGNDPSETLYLHIFAFALDAAQDPAVMDLAITLDYFTKFREKKILAQS